MDNLYFVVCASARSRDPSERREPVHILQRGIYHYVRKDPLAVGFILHKETSYVIQVLDSPLRIVHERDIFSSISAVDEITFSVRSGAS